MNKNIVKHSPHAPMWRNARLGAATLAIGALLSVSPEAFSQGRAGALAAIAASPAEPAPTFSTDVAPILQRSCQGCHNENGIGPMPLLTYAQVQRFAPLIKYRVENHTMPPWHLDKTIGIQEYKNDTSLTDAEIETIAQWVDAGTLEGDPGDLPPPLEFPSGDGDRSWRWLEDVDTVVAEIHHVEVAILVQGQWRSPAPVCNGL